jgi:hypothetical protein
MKNADELIAEEIWRSAWGYAATRWQTGRNACATNWNNASHAVSRKNQRYEGEVFAT